ncbi:hypothetical protein SAMN05421678_12360 [Actinopolymorpha cephalotaxi]|uniref:Uncharacterized protein n=1 Tax=Actinopolymorpha cephalotaxi TaxID=504797 RepID=A0A1I3BCC0_9ACTN|nr:hypothetical protein SAMN05421678_12360 [Actinopolymorpha cephalotaxi]
MNDPDHVLGQLDEAQKSLCEAMQTAMSAMNDDETARSHRRRSSRAKGTNHNSTTPSASSDKESQSLRTEESGT